MVNTFRHFRAPTVEADACSVGECHHLVNFSVLGVDGIFLILEVGTPTSSMTGWMRLAAFALTSQMFAVQFLLNRTYGTESCIRRAQPRQCAISTPVLAPLFFPGSLLSPVDLRCPLSVHAHGKCVAERHARTLS